MLRLDQLRLTTSVGTVNDLVELYKDVSLFIIMIINGKVSQMAQDGNMIDPAHRFYLQLTRSIALTYCLSTLLVRKVVFPLYSIRLTQSCRGPQLPLLQLHLVQLPPQWVPAHAGAPPPKKSTQRMETKICIHKFIALLISHAYLAHLQIQNH